MKINFRKAILAGIIGTLVMTAVGLWAAPMMGIPPMNPADLLAQQMGGGTVFGWSGHLVIGSLLALVYAGVSSRLAGPFAIRGALFGLAPFLMAQLLVMPMMGMPILSGSLPLLTGSLIGHLIYGSVVGAVYGAGAQQIARRAVVA